MNRDRAGAQPAVHPGQVWVDNDPRQQGERRLKVVRLDEDKRRVFMGAAVGYEDVITTYAIVRRVAPDGSLAGPYRRIRLDRLRPTSTGYRLAAHACRPGDCAPADGVQPHDLELSICGPDGWTWTCEHGRPHAWLEDAGWEPVYTPEEIEEWVKA